MSAFRLLCVCVCVVATTACGSSSSSGPDGGGGGQVDAAGSSQMVSFSNDVQPIFTSSCAYSGCHGGSFSQANLDLSSGNAYGNLVGVQSAEGCGLRVKAGSASMSYLAAKISGSGICYGTRMPRGGPLSSAQIKKIVDWINQGANKN